MLNKQQNLALLEFVLAKIIFKNYQKITGIAILSMAEVAPTNHDNLVFGHGS